MSLQFTKDNVERHFRTLANFEVPSYVTDEIRAHIAALEESASSYRSALQMAEEKCRHFDTGPEHNVSMCVICDQASAYSKQIDHAPDCPFSRLKESK